MSQQPPITHSPWHQGPPPNSAPPPPQTWSPNQPPYQQYEQPPPRRRRGFPLWVAIVIGLVVLLFLGGVIAMIVSSRGNKNATATPVASATSTPTAGATRAPSVAATTPLASAPTASASAPTQAAATATRPPAGTTTAASVIPPATRIPLTPQATQTFKVVASGFGQHDEIIGIGFIVENSDPSRAVRQSQYQVTAFDASGAVIGTESNDIELVLPGQRLGIGVQMYPSNNQKVAKIDVQVSAGQMSDTKEPPFTTEKATLDASTMPANVAGTITNARTQAVKQIYVAAIVYDDAGKIIGGGFNYVDTMPAHGQLAVNVQVIYDGTPAKVDLYATVSALSTV